MGRGGSKHVFAMGWMQWGACREVGSEFFYQVDSEERHLRTGYETRIAKGICATCDVPQECLEYALKTELPSTRYGIWGGTTPRERGAIMRERQKLKAITKPKVIEGRKADDN